MVVCFADFFFFLIFFFCFPSCFFIVYVMLCCVLFHMLGPGCTFAVVLLFVFTFDDFIGVAWSAVEYFCVLAKRSGRGRGGGGGLVCSVAVRCGVVWFGLV